MADALHSFQMEGKAKEESVEPVSALLFLRFSNLSSQPHSKLHWHPYLKTQSHYYNLKDQVEVGEQGRDTLDKASMREVVAVGTGMPLLRLVLLALGLVLVWMVELGWVLRRF
jgi:hypothetical protein